MISNILVQFVCLSAVLGLSYGSIALESLEKRLCKADFVFKFKVVSAARKVGCAGSPISKTTEPLNKNTITTAKTTSTPTTKTTAKTSIPQTSSHASVNTSNVPVFFNNQSTTKSSITRALTTANLQQNRTKRCIPFQHQSIVIPGNSVFKGKDKLMKIKGVTGSKLLDTFHSYIRLGLNFQVSLPLGDYLFIGRQAGKIEHQVFLSNPATVVSWNANTEQTVKKFDFVKDCKRQQNPTRRPLIFEP